MATFSSYLSLTHRKEIEAVSCATRICLPIYLNTSSLLSLLLSWVIKNNSFFSHLFSKTHQNVCIPDFLFFAISSIKRKSFSSKNYLWAKKKEEHE
jgi:hypothetical protein